MAELPLIVIPSRGLMGVLPHKGPYREWCYRHPWCQRHRRPFQGPYRGPGSCREETDNYTNYQTQQSIFFTNMTSIMSSEVDHGTKTLIGWWQPSALAVSNESCRHSKLFVCLNWLTRPVTLPFQMEWNSNIQQLMPKERKYYVQNLMEGHCDVGMRRKLIVRQETLQERHHDLLEPVLHCCHVKGRRPHRDRRVAGCIHVSQLRYSPVEQELCQSGASYLGNIPLRKHNREMLQKWFRRQQ